jgi:hypothetical protein
MLRFSKRWAVLLLAPVLLLATVTDVTAVTLTGTLRGRVTDERPAPPGVTIIARSEALIRERATTTDAEGSYFLPALAPGDYRVVSQMEGYVTLVFDTEVRLDETTDLNVTMKEGAISEQITVVAQKPMIDKASAEVSPSITPEMTNELPVLRQYQSLMGLAPGVANTDESGGNPNILGGTSNSNVYLVDGVSGRDPVTGTFGFNLNFDAIEALDLVGGSVCGVRSIPRWPGKRDDQVGEQRVHGVRARRNRFPVVDTALLRQLAVRLRRAPTSPGGCDPDGSQLLLLRAPHEFRPGPRPTSQRHPGHAGRADRAGQRLVHISYNRSETVAPQTLGNPAGGPFGNGTYVRTFQGISVWER